MLEGTLGYEGAMAYSTRASLTDSASITSSCVTRASRFMTRLFRATVGMAGIGVAAAPARRAVVCIGFSARILARRRCCAGD